MNIGERTNSEVGMRRLNDSVLRPGDIILTTTTESVSQVIRTTTGSDISHAMVYIEDQSVIDSDFDGVQARNTQRLFFAKECPIYVLRLRDGFSGSQLHEVLSYLRGHIGTEYSRTEAVLTLTGLVREGGKKQFCSRLVAQAFACAGISLVENPNFCTPAELKVSSLLSAVSDATVPVPVEEVAWWEADLDVTEHMRTVTNKVLNGARRRDAKIQTFDDLHRHLILNPKDDDEFCEVLQASGYLSVWEIEKNKNPWHYELELMAKFPPNQVEGYCRSVLANTKAGLHRYVVNLRGYLTLAQAHGLRFFAIMAKLYENLAILHDQRVTVAAAWLNNYGFHPPGNSPPLSPHSQEWFKAMEQWDPSKAGHIRKIIELSGRLDVCSLCGDDPAMDYRLAMEFRPEGAVDTLRLCDCCARFRRSAGELFLPLAEGEGK